VFYFENQMHIRVLFSLMRTMQYVSLSLSNHTQEVDWMSAEGALLPPRRMAGGRIHEVGQSEIERERERRKINRKWLL
jgi:hypothetical protein